MKVASSECEEDKERCWEFESARNSEMRGRLFSEELREVLTSESPIRTHSHSVKVAESLQISGFLC